MYETMINFYKKFSDFKEKVKMSNNNVESAPLRQPIIDSWCRTKDDEEVKFTFAWTIENFSKCQQQTGVSMSLPWSQACYATFVAWCMKKENRSSSITVYESKIKKIRA